MRHATIKLLGLLLTLTLVLTGCNLIGVDPLMQLDEDFAKLDKDYATVLAEYDGGTVTKGDALADFYNFYSYYSQMYSYFGMTVSDDTVESIKQQTLEHEVEIVAMHNEMANRGLTLSDEKLQEVEEAAETSYQTAYDAYAAQVTEKDAAVKARQTEYNMYLNGYTKDVFLKNETHEAEEEMLEAAVKAEIPELTDEELQAAYEEKVSEDESTYSEDLGAFESAMTDEEEFVTWMPEGYRTVKHILIKPDAEYTEALTNARGALENIEEDLEDYQAELDELNEADESETEAEAEATEAEATDTEATEAEAAETEATAAPEVARTAQSIQEDIDLTQAELEEARQDLADAEAAMLESVKDKTDEIYAKLAEGADFNDLIAEYGEDPGMQNEPTATRGYYVSANSENWDKSFTAGALALAAVGDVSQTPVASGSGVHIIRYESDVTPGAVPLDQIRDTLYDMTLETRQEEHYEEALQSWISALNPVYHVDAFNIG